MSAMSSVSRDPSQYHPTEHAVLRRRKRGFEWDWVSKTIQEGFLHDHLERSTICFEYQAKRWRYPLKVIANPETGDIVTVRWDKDD